MKKYLYLMLFFAASLTAAHAQSGCGDSPECSTLVLGAFGAFGAAGAVLRSRFRSRR
jgi:XrtJ-associated TM-motif-TM protein